MNTKFKQLRAVLTQEEWDNFLANLNLPESYFVCVPLDEILSSAFCWKYSPQGHDYWEAIRERVHNNDLVSETFKTAPESTPQAEIQPQDKQEQIMKTENTNDFSKCKVGDKLWSIQLGDCEILSVTNTELQYPILVCGESRRRCTYTRAGMFYQDDINQSLFFSNPNIIAPPEPPRLPDYKEGQWIAVWGCSLPKIQKFVKFSNEECMTENDHGAWIKWENHCTLEELPEVLAKWGERK